MESQATPLKVGIKYGIIFGLVSVIITAISHALGIDTSGSNVTGSIIMGLISVVVYVAGMVLANNEFKKFNEGYMSFGEGFQIGLFFSILAGLLNSTYTLVYVTLINPSFLTDTMNTQIEAFEAQGMSEEQIEQAISLTKMMMTPTTMWFSGIIGSLCVGIIVSLIVAAITKKDRM